MAQPLQFVGNYGSADYSSLSRLRVDINAETNVAEVVLCRANEMNVMDHLFFEEVGKTFFWLDRDDRVNAVLIWAEGRMFTAGLDLKEAAGILGGLPSADVSPAEVNTQFYRTIRTLQDHFLAVKRCRKPVVAAVHGKCIGGGVDLITSADVRVCTSDAVFSIREAKVGLVADLGTLQRIARIVGPGAAREMAYTAGDYSADFASSSRLVNNVYNSKEEMLEKARDMVSRIGGLSPLVVQGTKVTLAYADEHSEEDSLMQIALWNSAFIKSEDLQEAFMSFMQKRKPLFKNRL